ncbi:hypothetical protein BH09BAC4_BH09BAC4_39670 [soil metagenome]
MERQGIQSDLRVEAFFVSSFLYWPIWPFAGYSFRREIAQNGMDLAKLNAMLLEKIEELTLYSIQLEKTNQQQGQKLQLMEQRQVQSEQMLKEVLDRNGLTDKK